MRALRVKRSYWDHYTGQKSNGKKPWNKTNKTKEWWALALCVEVMVQEIKGVSPQMSSAVHELRSTSSETNLHVGEPRLLHSSVWRSVQCEAGKCSERSFPLLSRSDVAIQIIKSYRISIKAGTWEEIFATCSLFHMVLWISSSLTHILRYLVWHLSLMEGQVSFILLMWVSRICYIDWCIKSLAL